MRPLPEDEAASASQAPATPVDDCDEGEIVVRSPEMLSKYIFDPQATAAAHTHDGYYRTGDIARREVCRITKAKSSAAVCVERTVVETVKGSLKFSGICFCLRRRVL